MGEWSTNFSSIALSSVIGRNIMALVWPEISDSSEYYRKDPAY